MRPASHKVWTTLFYDIDWKLSAREKGMYCIIEERNFAPRRSLFLHARFILYTFCNSLALNKLYKIISYTASCTKIKIKFQLIMLVFSSCDDL